MDRAIRGCQCPCHYLVGGLWEDWRGLLVLIANAMLTIALAVALVLAC